MEGATAFVQLLAEYRFSVVQLATHAGTLRSLPGEHEGDSRGRAFVISVHATRTVFKGRNSVRSILTDDHPALSKRLAPNLHRVGDVGQLQIGIPAKVVREVGAHRVQRS